MTMKPENEASRKFSSPAMMITRVDSNGGGGGGGEIGHGARTGGGVDKKRLSQPIAVLNSLTSRMPLKSFTRLNNSIVRTSVNEEAVTAIGGASEQEHANDTNPLEDRRLSNNSSSASFYSQSSKLRVQIWFKNRILFIALSVIILTILGVIIFLLVDSWRKH